MVTGQECKGISTSWGRENRNCHKCHFVFASDEFIVVQMAFAGGASLEKASLSEAVTETFFDPPDSYTTYVVQGRTVEVTLAID